MEPMIRTYSELVKIDSFIDRFKYLELKGKVGYETFGYNRYLNQILYKSEEWREFRRKVLIRDSCCEMGLEGYDIDKEDYPTVHHMNPTTVEDVINRRKCVFDFNNVVTVSSKLHKGIHYGSRQIMQAILSFYEPVERRKYDTCPWKINRF